MVGTKVPKPDMITMDRRENTTCSGLEFDPFQGHNFEITRRGGIELCII